MLYPQKSLVLTSPPMPLGATKLGTLQSLSSRSCARVVVDELHFSTPTLRPTTNEGPENPTASTFCLAEWEKYGACKDREGEQQKESAAFRETSESWVGESNELKEDPLMSFLTWFCIVRGDTGIWMGEMLRLCSRCSRNGKHQALVFFTGMLFWGL